MSPLVETQNELWQPKPFTELRFCETLKGFSTTGAASLYFHPKKIEKMEQNLYHVHYVGCLLEECAIVSIMISNLFTVNEDDEMRMKERH